MIVELLQSPKSDILWDDYIEENFKRITLAFRGLAGSTIPDTFGEIQSISVNNKAVTIVNKNVNITVPVNISDLKDIESTNPKENQALIWSKEKNKYVNKDIVATDEKVKMDVDSDAKFLSEFIGNTMMVKDGFLEVKSISGMNVTISNLNTLAGIEKPIKPILESIGSAMSFGGTVKTYNDLLKISQPNNGIVKVVLTDEMNGDQPYTYVYVESTKTWEPIAAMTLQLRDFTLNPIDLTKEVTGKLPQANMDMTDIVKKNDIKDFLTENKADDIYVRKESLSDDDKVLHESDVVNDITSTEKNKPASADIVRQVAEQENTDKKMTDQAIEALENRIKSLEDTNGSGEEDKENEYIKGVKRNGTILPVYDDGTVNVLVPTKTSDLTNDSKYITEDKLKEMIDNKEIGSGNGGGTGGSSVTESTINGNIMVDGEEVKVYDDTSVMKKEDYVSEENDGYVKKADEAIMVEALKNAPPNSVLGVDRAGIYGAYRLPFGEDTKYKGIYQMVMLNPPINSPQTIESDVNLGECGVFIQAYKFIEGDQDTIAILKEFNNTNKDSFYYNNENVEFDNGMKIKTLYKYESTKNGDIYKTIIDKSKFKGTLLLEVFEL